MLKIRGVTLVGALVTAFTATGAPRELRDANGEPLPIYIMSADETVILSDGAIVRYQAATKKSRKSDYVLGVPQRVPTDGDFRDISAATGNYANTTDEYLGSSDFLDERATQISWFHSAGGSNAFQTYSKNAALDENRKCPTNYFGLTYGIPAQLLCMAPNGVFTYAKGYRHVLPGPAVYQTRINPQLASADINYTAKGGVLESAGGDNQSTVVGEAARGKMRIRLKDADGAIVRMPLAGNYSNISTRIVAPAKAVGAHFDFDGVRYPDGDGTAEGTFVAGDKPGTYTVYFSHPDAGTTELAMSVNVQTRVPPEDDVAHEEENGKEPCLSVADPIQLSTGNVWEHEVDYPQSGLSPLEFSRTYNSQGSKSQQTGTLWTTSYDRFVVSASGSAKVRRPDGRTIRFVLAGGVYVAAPHFRGKLAITAGGWTYTDEDGTIEDFDTAGRLTKITHLNGLQQTVARNTKGQIATVTSNTGGSLSFTYNADGQLATLKDPSARVWTYAYDAWANLRSVKMPNGVYQSYKYESPASPYLLTSAMYGTAPGIGVQSYGVWEYDSYGRGIANHAQEGTVKYNRINVAYGNDGTHTTTDAKGNATVFAVARANGRGFLSSITGPGFASCGLRDSVFEFDSAMRVIADTRFGQRTEYGNFDAWRQPRFQIEAAGTQSARRTEFTYDARFAGKPTSILQPSVVAGRFRQTDMAYNAAGRPTTVTESGYRPDGLAVSRTTTYEYNGPFGQLSRIDGPRSDVADVWTLDYDATSKRLKSVTDPAGTVVRSNITYTPTGNVKSETRPNGITLTYGYNAGTDRLETLTETSSSLTRLTRWTYDDRGRVTSLTFSDTSSSSVGIGFTYDAAGNLIYLGAGGGTTKLTRDAAGNVSNEQRIDADGRTRYAIQRTFDEYNRVQSLVGVNSTRQSVIHPSGTISGSIDGRAQGTSYSYDELKRLTTVIRPGSLPVSIGYDNADRISSITDGKGGQSLYIYDDLGNRISATSPDTGVTTFTHDAAGNLISSRDSKGQVTTYTYDALNRQKTIDRVGSEYDETWT